ncbi:hypothetical protein [Desertivirga brevis]|uniref:hypothetical protein n=1 Tax=Desertivirga brevis TaxID=2810310 RepID=UPI001A972747|nr:hypothetical protein [Pedobacter sp. SYSU D00873]
MEEPIIITAENQNNVWLEIEKEFKNQGPIAVFHFEFEKNDRRILLDIDGNKQSTTFSSIIYNRSDFRFAIHPQGVIGELGKFFGMQDVVLGYKEFDDRFIIKTNQESRVESLFADEKVRNLLISVPELCLGIVEYLTENEEGKVPFLELKVDGYINETQILKELLQVFYNLLTKVDS